MERIVREIHKPARVNFVRRSVVVLGLDECWQADLVHMENFASDNDGYRFILAVIDIYSKFAWAIPLKNKTGVCTSCAFEELLQTGTCRIPEKLQTDNGTEFYNPQFKSVMKKYGIHHYSSYTHLKASIVERWIRTLKSKLWLAMSLHGSYRWVDILQKTVAEYNRSFHRTIRMAPIDVRDNSLMDTVYARIKVADHREQKFKIGDYVRISKHRHSFTKGYLPQWTTEIFRIVAVKHAFPRTYILKDLNGDDVAGRFYSEELQKTKKSDVYLVEKVVRRKGDKVLVSWLGFPESANSWINIRDFAKRYKSDNAY